LGQRPPPELCVLANLSSRKYRCLPVADIPLAVILELQLLFSVSYLQTQDREKDKDIAQISGGKNMRASFHCGVRIANIMLLQPSV
jgi:hypothetical protein